MDDLATWLPQQHNEDERVARAARDAWLWNDTIDDNGQAFIERLGIDRWLAEVDAKRRRLDRHQPDTHFLHGTICRWCSTPQVGAYQSWPCPDVRDDAAIYADRPGYRPEWGPDRA